jgi:hypothetical protein
MQFQAVCKNKTLENLSVAAGYGRLLAKYSHLLEIKKIKLFFEYAPK